MACSITTAKGLSCKDTTGGVKALYLGDFDPASSMGMTYASGVLDGIPDALTVCRYDVQPQTASLVTTVQNDAGGSAAYTSALEVTFNGLSQVDSEQLQTIIQTRFYCFLLDANDVIWSMGLVNGCSVSGGTFVTGAARTDLTGYTLTIECAEGVYPPAITPSISSIAVNAPFDGVAAGAGEFTVTNPA